MQGRIQDFLREGASQADMTDVQSQKSAEELPNMHVSANWVSWQSTIHLLTALIEYLTFLLDPALKVYRVWSLCILSVAPPECEWHQSNHSDYATLP